AKTIPPDSVIVGRIDAAGNAFDVDRSGATQVSTDAVYVARRLLGLTPACGHAAGCWAVAGAEARSPPPPVGPCTSPAAPASIANARSKQGSTERAIGPPRARTRPEQMRGRDAHLPLDRPTPIGPFVATAESGPRSRVAERETGLRVSRLAVGVVLLMAGTSLLGSTSASGAVMTYVVNSTDDEANA